MLLKLLLLVLVVVFVFVLVVDWEPNLVKAGVGGKGFRFVGGGTRK